MIFLIKYALILHLFTLCDHTAAELTVNVTDVNHTGAKETIENGTIQNGEIQRYKIKLSPNVKYLQIRSSSENATFQAQLSFVLHSASKQTAWRLPFWDSEPKHAMNKFSQQVCAADKIYLLEVATFSSVPIMYEIEIQTFTAEQLSFHAPNTISVKVGEPYNSFLKFPPPTKDNGILIIKLFSNTSDKAKISIIPHDCTNKRSRELEIPSLILTMTTRAFISIDRKELSKFRLVTEMVHDNQPNGNFGQEQTITFQNNTNWTDLSTAQSKNISVTLSFGEVSNNNMIPVVHFLFLSLGGGFLVLLMCIIPEAQHLLRWPRTSPSGETKEYIRNAETRLTQTIEKKLPTKTEGRKLTESQRNKIAHIEKGFGIKQTKTHVHDRIKLSPQTAGSFLVGLLIIAVFYYFPAFQMILDYYTRSFKESRDQDACYHNYECAQPWGPFDAANNIISNAAYVLCGVMFLIIVKFHSGNLTWRFLQLFYAMGVGLILEGVLSASYHICPTPQNFQFDTTFMYLISGLCTYHLFQMRHPWHVNHPFKFYGMFAMAVVFVVIGIWTENSTARLLIALIYFAIAICAGYFINKTMFQPHSLPDCQIENFWLIIIFRAIHTVVFLGFIIFGTYALVADKAKFPTIQLFMFISNLTLYTVFAIAVKISRGERLVVAPITCGVVGILLWIVSIYYFTIEITKWEVDPAESRALNRPCVLFNYFDHHDVWHLGSAYALFVSFLLLLTLDDGQANETAGRFARIINGILDAEDKAIVADERQKIEDKSDTSSADHASK